MPSEQDKTADRINLPLLGVALGVVVVGFILTILVATMWIGLPLMALGGIWAAALLVTAKLRARSHVLQ